jgi:hypothetical protein
MLWILTALAANETQKQLAINKEIQVTITFKLQISICSIIVLLGKNQNTL